MTVVSRTEDEWERLVAEEDKTVGKAIDECCEVALASHAAEPLSRSMYP